MTFRVSNIRRAQQAAWEEIQASLQILRRRRWLLNNRPEELTDTARRNAGRLWDQQVLEETVWALSRTGYLATPEQREVVQQAHEWAKSWTDSPPTPQEPEDYPLYTAVQTWLTTLDPDDSEELSLPPATVPSTH